MDQEPFIKMEKVNIVNRFELYILPVYPPIIDMLDRVIIQSFRACHSKYYRIKNKKTLRVLKKTLRVKITTRHRYAPYHLHSSVILFTGF